MYQLFFNNNVHEITPPWCTQIVIVDIFDTANRKAIIVLSRRDGTTALD